MSSNNSKIWNGIPLRVIFGVLAVLLSVFAWFQYQKIDALQAIRGETGSPEKLSKLETSPEVAECAERRFANINKMVVDGFMASESVEEEKSNATSLCIAQNAR